MKKLAFAAFAALALASCSQADLSETNNSAESFTPDYESIKPFNEISVFVPEDSVAIVLYKGDTLAVTNYSGTVVKVPNNIEVATRSVDAPSSNNKIEIVYESNAINNNINASIISRSFNRQTIMFEDTKQGDNDYNDFVFQVYQEKISPLDVLKGGKPSESFGIRTLIQPVALGSDKSTVIKLGVDVIYEEGLGLLSKPKKLCQEYVVSEDVRKDAGLFNDYKTSDGFINTTNLDKRFKAVELPTISPMNTNIQQFNETSYWFNWWIEVNGERLYSIPEEQMNCDNWHNGNGFPYGLVFTDVYGDKRISTMYSTSEDGNDHGMNWLNYPAERNNIETVYPGFNDWLQGKAGAILDFANPIAGKYFDAMGQEVKMDIKHQSGFIFKNYWTETFYYYPNSLFFYEAEK